ncbi:MAG: TolC family protein [Ignavibacteriales bacterium]|nr:MAG: TolC family protein [Ignavibacteriales bacterium]
MLNKFRCFCFVILLFLIHSYPLISQNSIKPDSALQLILTELDGSELSLTTTKELAEKNATFLKRAEANYLAALGSLRRERGSFDPELYFNLMYSDMNEPTASFFAGADVLITERTTSQTGLRLKLPFGTELDLALNTVTLNTNSQFAFLNPEYDAFGSLSFRQPLLRGLTLSGRKNLTKAEFDYESAKALYEQELLAINAVAEQLYWNLYTAERDYAVQKLTYERAEAFLTETQLRNNAGLVGPNQVASAKTFFAEQKLMLIDREEQLDTRSDLLATLIGMRPTDNNVRFKVTDSPPSYFEVEPVDLLVERALKNNLELIAAQKQLESANSLVDAGNWEFLPKLDIVGSLVSTGIGGESQDVIFGTDTLRSTTNGSFGDVLSQVFKRKFPGWSVGVELSLPIGLRPGLGEKDRLEAEAMNYEQRYIELSRILEQQVRSAHRELVHGNSRLIAAQEGVEAAQEQVRIGMIEFQNGRITAFELVRLSEDFAVAQRRYSEALVKNVNAAATLTLLTSGTYLSERN